MIISSPREQYKIVGNGVSRSISYSLGLSLLRSAFANARTSQEALDNQVAAQECSPRGDRTVLGPDENHAALTNAVTPSGSDGLLLTPPLSPHHELGCDEDDATGWIETTESQQGTCSHHRRGAKTEGTVTFWNHGRSRILRGHENIRVQMLISNFHTREQDAN